MKIKIVHKGNRNQLICERNDESVEMADLGPSLPFHDIAHYVVEKHLHLTQGFYGNISRGMTVRELSDKAIIKTLSVESTVAEIATRALQSIWSGAVPVQDYADLLLAEFSALSIPFNINLTKIKVQEMVGEYQKLISEWNSLSQGEYLELEI